MAFRAPDAMPGAGGSWLDTDPRARPGGGTIIGVEAAAKAPPDGSTLVLVTPSFIINATGLKKLPYDSIRDFAPVTLFASSPLLLVAHGVSGKGRAPQHREVRLDELVLAGQVEPDLKQL